MGEGVNLVNPADETAISLKKMLKENGISAENNAKPHYEFYVSDAAEKFRTFANSIMPFEIDETNRINIEEY